ncbi:MAG: hypothetical protein U9N34_10570, partial [Candidatus Cloacimonadota bacterium]|nr:hypothetical protein [Candidatus Cloacimonadota bacterium]
MKNQTRLLILLFIIFVIAGCKKNDYGFQTIKKVLYIDSNNSEDEWSQEVLSSAKSILKKQKNVEIKTFFMDSKRNITESYKIKAANRGKHTIEEWKPD